ncbi:Hypothetical protein NTJ_14342 [Nesidiocoris tenuis]|uniref:Histone deacetylase interacting domain-containing protein n=1 Tax=Nesidiocoris tenuis TaxID=355587 RepID=A0ABN7BAV8_9HEMI|nr:Hypothetical protein NTJ_14342 [Nesidiocoris tenuis]
MSSYEYDREWATISDVENTLLRMSRITQNAEAHGVTTYVPPMRVSEPVRREVHQVKNTETVRGRGELLKLFENQAHPEFKAQCIREELEKLGRVDYSDSAFENMLGARGQFDDLISESDPLLEEPSFNCAKAKKPSDPFDFCADEQIDADDSTDASVDASDLSTSVDMPCVDFGIDPMRRYGFNESHYSKIDPRSVVSRSKTPSPCSSPLPNRTLIEESLEDSCSAEDVPAPDSSARLNGELETWQCLDAIKEKFFSEPEKYNAFMKIMKDWKNERINSRTMLNRVSQLLCRHPDILGGFKRLVSPEKLQHVDSTIEKPEQKPSQDNSAPKRCRNALVLALLKKEVDGSKIDARVVDGDVTSADVALRYADVVKDWIEKQSDPIDIGPGSIADDARGLVMHAVSAALDEISKDVGSTQPPKLLRPDDFCKDPVDIAPSRRRGENDDD